MKHQSNVHADAPAPPHAPPDENAEDFGHSDPLVIGARLRHLVNGGDFLTVQHTGGHLVTQLLDVDARARIFIVDWSASTRQNDGLLSAARCEFSAQPDGVRIEFATPSPRETRFDGRPAFEVDFPEVLHYLQRRAYFRVDTPVRDVYTCTGAWPEGRAFRFEVHDLSLGGVGVRTADERVAEWPIGMSLRDCELSLGRLGRLSIDLKLVSHRATGLPKGGRRHDMGFRFLTLPSHMEGKLQRLITQLELRGNASTR